MSKKYFLSFCACLLVVFVSAASARSEQPLKMPPFRHGINLTLWFEAGSPEQIQFTRFTHKDFENIKSLGVDVIRLPINLHYMTNGAPDYTLDPLFLEFLDKAVFWAEELGIYIILDDHTFNSSVPTDMNVDTVLLKVWPQMAEHFKTRSDFVLYEVLNEPHGIDTALWGKIQGKVIDAIRAVDTRHTIVVGAANYNNYNDLASLPVYTDSNLIYTFHFYDPMVFTHQGASWTDPSLASLAHVPFPAGAGKVPDVPKELKGTWQGSNISKYASVGSPEKMKSLLEIAAKFAKDRHVAIFCGELGVYMPNSKPDDRARWYRMVREDLENKNIAWASWDYFGGFGLFNKPTGGDFQSDLNVSVVEALGFTAPPQKAHVIQSETGEIDIFQDYAGAGILSGSYNKEGKTNFYSLANTASGKYAISWENGERYSNISFEFLADRDFSVLKQSGYVLEFMAYTKNAGATFDVRFLNPGLKPEDKPWRMTYPIDGTILPADGAWHKIRIPLADMKETGAWKDAWFTPDGKFSWNKIASFEIAAEQGAMTGKSILFDDIKITK